MAAIQQQIIDYFTCVQHKSISSWLHHMTSSPDLSIYTHNNQPGSRSLDKAVQSSLKSKSDTEVDDTVSSVRTLSAASEDRQEDSTSTGPLWGDLDFGLKNFVIFPKECRKTAWCLTISAKKSDGQVQYLTLWIGLPTIAPPKKV